MIIPPRVEHFAISQETVWPPATESTRCPLWVISKHVQRKSRGPLGANSGHIENCADDLPFQGLAIIFLRDTIGFVTAVARISNGPELFSQCISVNGAGRR